VDEALRAKQLTRDPAWSESLAIGQPAFVEEIKRKLGVRGMHRESREIDNGGSVLKERADVTVPTSCQKCRV